MGNHKYFNNAGAYVSRRKRDGSVGLSRTDSEGSCVPYWEALAVFNIGNERVLKDAPERVQ